MGWLESKCRLPYVMPSEAVRDAQTATGGSFHSDGRVLVMALGP